MPRKLVFFGRPVRLGSRRLTTLIGFFCLVAICFIFALTGSLPDNPRLAAVPDNAIPHIRESLSKSALNPFRQPSHPPPRKENDEYGGSSWWSDWKWLAVPFSSSMTLDEDRALLPPLLGRPPIYCYYDATSKKPREEKDAESDMLLAWRRAWWAQGFRPTILSPAEAMSNPAYDQVQRIDLEPHVKNDMMKWLAWETMKGGLLADWTLFPMASWEDPFLSYLRRGEYPQLTNWNGTGDGLYAGHFDAVRVAVRSLLDVPPVEFGSTVLSKLKASVLRTDDPQSSLAHYIPEVIKHKYPEVAKKVAESKSKGTRSLTKLINAHLQVTWQNRFSKGIEVLKPFPEHTTVMINGSLTLAKTLAMCPESPMPSSCPPNNPRCTPCSALGTQLRISTPASYHNSSERFTIGTVPHPWTLAALANLRENIDVSWIRRESDRDPWLSIVTERMLGTGVAGHGRITHFKQAVAGEAASARTLWLPAESDTPQDLDWHFGFMIPHSAIDDGKSLSPVPADRIKPADEPHVNSDGPVASEEDIALEPPLLAAAKEVVAQIRSTEQTKTRASLEAWSMADTEAWKFARAFAARRRMVWEQWDKAEGKYSQGAGTEKGRNTWNRWQDHVQ